VIGMTNRKDMIDEALLRPGRLEVQIEVSLPDRDGRHQIFTIHTAKMRGNKLMGTDVSLDYLADNSKNFSGAEIEGVVKSASSFAFNRHIEGGTMAKVAESVSKLQVTAIDFKHALDEVIPAFGVTTADFEGTMLNGIIDFGPTVERTLNSGDLFVRQVANSVRTPLISVLVHGPSGAGTTSLAVKIAKNSNFPYIKLITPENMVGMNEINKASMIAKVFENAYKSPLAVIVVDSIEKLLEFVPIGPRFSNIVLQALIVLLKRVPPPGHRLFVICTTSKRSVLEEMGMSECFSGELYFPNIQTVEEVGSVLKQLNIFGDEQLAKVLSLLRAMQADEKLSIGIKKLLLLAEMARQDQGREIEKFVEAMQEHLGRGSGF
jgi:vesicle-fusing ATPase